MITTYEQLPLFLTVEELATTLKIGKTTAYQLVRLQRCFHTEAIRACEKDNVHRKRAKDGCVHPERDARKSLKTH